MHFEGCIGCGKFLIVFALKDGKCEPCRTGKTEDQLEAERVIEQERLRIDPAERLSYAADREVLNLPIRRRKKDSLDNRPDLSSEEAMEKINEIHAFYKEATAAVIGFRAANKKAAEHFKANPEWRTPVEVLPETFGFNHPEDGSGERFAVRRKKYNIPWVDHSFWWVVHNAISHPLIAFIPLRPFFKFHDWTSRRLHGVK